MSVLVETIRRTPGTRRTYDIVTIPPYYDAIKSQTIVTTRPRSASPRLRNLIARMSLEREEERRGLNKTIRSLKLENEKANDDYDTLLRRIAELESINNTLKDDNRILQTSLEIERDRVVSNEREHVRAREALRETLERRNAELLLENDDLKKELEDRENDLLDKDATIARLERENVETEMSATRTRQNASLMEETLKEELAHEKKLHKQALRARNEARAEARAQTTIRFNSPQRGITAITTSPFRKPKITYTYSNT